VQGDETDIVDDSAEVRHSVAMRLLDAGVPLSLLFDLVSPDGPNSEAILAFEKLPRDPVDSLY
jgi:hypothetical protein